MDMICNKLRDFLDYVWIKNKELSELDGFIKELMQEKKQIPNVLIEGLDGFKKGISADNKKVKELEKLFSPLKDDILYKICNYETIDLIQHREVS